MFLNPDDVRVESSILYEEQNLITEVETETRFTAQNLQGDDSDVESEGLDFEFTNNYVPSEDISHLPQNEQHQIKQFPNETRSLWQQVSASGPEELGVAGGTNFVIRVKDTPPIYTPPHRRSIHEETKLAKEVIMLDAQVIEPSNSEWNSPIFLVKKKDGSMRPVVDYRLINAVTITEPFPMPNPQDIFDSLAMSE